MSNNECSEKHDVLYHYTTYEGLLGILETQTLWATHYRHLNDDTEITRLKSILPSSLVPTFKKFMKQMRAEGKPVKQALKEFNGTRHELALHEATRVSDLMFDGAFSTINDRKNPLFEPFITSFCTHLQDDIYTRNNGLLSMWNSYGANGGVAIVFDTQQLEHCMVKEAEEFGHSMISLGDVVYEGDSIEFENEFGDTIELIKGKMWDLLSQNKVSFDDVLQPYLSCSTRLKHRAFKEEREVRMVSMPWNEQPFSDGEERNKTIKQECLRKGRHSEIRYITLFDGEMCPRLPIKKIIVGPYTEQSERSDKIASFTKKWGNIEVCNSDTPLIER